jgi:GntR family transcriptional regulator
VFELRLKNEPLYAQASEAVEKIIDAQGLKPGDKLPPETRLAELLGVSRSTVREALRELELQRRIIRVHGRGTIVAHPAPIVTGLDTLESLESLARRQGWRCETRNVEIATVPLPAEAATALELPPGEPVTWLGRVKTRQSQPIWRAETWIPETVLSVDQLRKGFQTSILDLLRAGFPRVDYALANVSAAAASKTEAALLSVSAHNPLVILIEIFYEAPDRALCYSRNALIPDSVALQVRRRPIENNR